MMSKIPLPRLWLLALCLLVTGAWASGQDLQDRSLQWQPWSPAVFEEARREGRLVLLDLTAEWCLFCRKMDQTTYRDEQVMDAIGRAYVPVRADESVYPELAKRYERAGRPATVIFAADGTEIIKRRGYLSARLMVWMLDAVAQNPAPEAHR